VFVGLLDAAAPPVGVVEAVPARDAAFWRLASCWAKSFLRSIFGFLRITNGSPAVAIAEYLFMMWAGRQFVCWLYDNATRPRQYVGSRKRVSDRR